MATHRKHALAILEGHARRVQQHFQKIEAESESRALKHWKSEISVWLTKMEAMVRHVGKKTGSEWAKRIADWWERLEA